MTRILFLENETTLRWLDTKSSLAEIQRLKTTRELADKLDSSQLTKHLKSLPCETIHVVSTGSLAVIFPQPLEPDSKPAPLLTPRQKQVLQALLTGLATKQIAAQLKLSERTVLMHVRSLKTLLGASSREQLFMRAIACGYHLPNNRGS